MDLIFRRCSIIKLKGFFCPAVSFLLVNNLDLNGVPLTSVGNTSTRFTGTFHGNNYLGLIGYNYYTTVTSCRASGNVSGALESAGGLIGYNDHSTVSSSFVTGNVCASNYSNASGGLVGYNKDGVIKSSYSTSPVNANNCAGGLIGYLYGGSVDDSYSAGPVSVNGATVGGLVSFNVGGSATVTDSFWDTQTSGRPVSAGGAPKTTEEMQTLATFTAAGWDFASTWTLCESTNYPRFPWQIPALDWFCPDGVNTEELAFLAQHWLRADCSPANDYCSKTDLNLSGAVNLLDLSLFAQAWLRQ